MTTFGISPVLSVINASPHFADALEFLLALRRDDMAGWTVQQFSPCIGKAPHRAIVSRRTAPMSYFNSRTFTFLNQASSSWFCREIGQRLRG